MYKAVGYVRVSGNADAEVEVSVIKRYADKMGLKSIRIYEDFDIEKTGNISSTLGGIFGLLDDCASNPYIIIVIVRDKSDLVRVETDVNFIDELSVMGKRIVVVGSSISKKILKKISKATSSSASGPISQSGPVPYGYRRFDIGGSFFIEPHEIESPVVKMIFDKYRDFKSFARVQRHLNSSLIKTRRGNSWSRAGLSWMLRNHVYAGRTKVGSEFVETHTPIVDTLSFDAIQEIMISRKRNIDV